MVIYVHGSSALFWSTLPAALHKLRGDGICSATSLPRAAVYGDALVQRPIQNGLTASLCLTNAMI